MGFSLDISKFAQKTNRNLLETAKAIKIDLFSGVIYDTRVDTGLLRNNWQTTTGSPATGTRKESDKSGTNAIAEVVQVVEGDTVDYLTNNLEYAHIWNEKDGIIDKNLQRINRTVKAAVSKNK